MITVGKLRSILELLPDDAELTAFSFEEGIAGSPTDSEHGLIIKCEGKEGWIETGNDKWHDYRKMINKKADG